MEILHIILILVILIFLYCCRIFFKEQKILADKIRNLNEKEWKKREIYFCEFSNNPTWRVSFLYSFLTSLISSYILYYLNIKNNFFKNFNITFLPIWIGSYVFLNYKKYHPFGVRCFDREKSSY